MARATRRSVSPDARFAAPTFQQPSSTLVRYVLLEKDDKRTRAAAKQAIDGTRFATGDVLDAKVSWRKRKGKQIQCFFVYLQAASRVGALPEQLSGLNDHVSCNLSTRANACARGLTAFCIARAVIHTKFLVIDAFSDDPIVVCGSANFSTASNVNNDENMLIM